VPYKITSVTSKLTREINIREGTFKYSHITETYFWGYQKIEGFLIALPEKALLDTIFFMCLGRASLNYDEFLLDEINFKKFREMTEKIKNPNFHRFLKKLKL